VNRHSKSLAGMLGVALLIGSVAAGCGRRGGADVSPTPIPPAASPVASMADQSPLVPDATDTIVPGASATPIADSTSSTGAQAAASDPVDTDLQGVNQLLNGIDSSISGSSSGGGE